MTLGTDIGDDDDPSLSPAMWWKDVVRESVGGSHTQLVSRGLNIGFLLFLASEVMLFVSFFWAFFHSSLAPSVELGNTWAPLFISPVNPWAIPFLGSTVLLASGFLVTLAHRHFDLGEKDPLLVYLL